MSRVRRCCFTLFIEDGNPSQEDLSNGLNGLGAEYFIFQKERCPTTGKDHWQGYVRFKGRVRFNAIKAVWRSIHLETCKGSEQQNVEYCSKSASRVEGPFEDGVRAHPGKRNDLDLVRDLVASGASMRQICENPDVSSYQSLRSAELMLKYKRPKAVENRTVFWFHGSTGSGKTRWVHDHEEDLWCNSIDSKWYDSYCGESAALIDDYRPSQIPFSIMLKLLDRYPLRVPFKGGFVSWDPERIYITCPYSIEECFKARSDEDVEQLKRRVFEERLFGNVVKRKEYSAVASNFK